MLLLMRSAKGFEIVNKGKSAGFTLVELIAVIVILAILSTIGTGFVVKTIEEMVKAIKKIDQIKRKECRSWVEKKFSYQRMIDDYERIFLRILKK